MGGKGVKIEKTGETTQLQTGNPGLKFPVATGQLKSVWAWKPASPSRSQGPKDKTQDASHDGRRLSYAGSRLQATKKL